MPVANRGEQAEGMALLSAAVHTLEEAMPKLGVASEAGQEVMKSLPRLAKHVPPGAVSAGVENTALQKIMLKNRQNSMAVAQMRAGPAPQQPKPGMPPGMPPTPAAPPPMAA